MDLALQTEPPEYAAKDAGGRGALERRFERALREAITRRAVLRRGAAGALGASLIGQLAACGDDELGGKGSAADAPRVERQPIADELLFSNWPLYIDEKRTSLKLFERKYGTRVKYVEEINDNQEFYGKVNQQYATSSSRVRRRASCSGRTTCRSR